MVTLRAEDKVFVTQERRGLRFHLR